VSPLNAATSWSFSCDGSHVNAVWTLSHFAQRHCDGDADVRHGMSAGAPQRARGGGALARITSRAIAALTLCAQGRARAVFACRTV
jgi:hypothetical protein